MKKWTALILVFTLLVCLAGCKDQKKEAEPTEPNNDPVTAPVVGLCMPDQADTWQNQAQQIRSALAQLGYQTKIEFADADPEKQAQQVQKLVEEGVSCLIITPVDAMALAEVLLNAQEQQIPVVAYDRHLTGMETVDALITFDYEDMGRQLGNYIVTAKALEEAPLEQERYSVEFIMGSADDNTALLFHNGLMSVLQPYLDAGVLECPSGRTAFADTYVLQSDPQQANRKCADLLQMFYQDAAPDILCVASDRMVGGCVEALLDAGYEEGWPLVTGREGTLDAVQRILDGQQAVTIYKDTPALAKTCANVVDALVNGKKLPTDNILNNHAIDVPAAMGSTQLVDLENYETLLLDTGIYSKNDLTFPK